MTEQSDSSTITTDGQPITPLIPSEASPPADETKATPEVAKAEPKPNGKAHEEQTLAPPPTKDEARTYAREFLLGELIKAVKSEFLPLKKSFIELKEFEQESLLRRVQNRLEAAAKEAIEIIAADARLTFRTEVDSVTFKDGVKAVLKMAKTEHAHILADQSGHSVLVVIEDFARFMNPGEETRGMPDQPSLFDKSQGARITEGAPPRKSPPKAAKKKPNGKASGKGGKKK